jgi:Sec-independent protein translocase protein TatA
VNISEILVVLLVALLVLKPAQLPEAAFAIGKLTKMMRRLFTNIKSEMDGLIASVDEPEEQKRE